MRTRETYDVVIIGGGVVGAAIARELSRYSVHVVLLEKEAELAFGVSKSNSGIIHPGTQNPPDSLKGKLCVQGNRMMRDIAKELGVDFQEVGELILAFSDADIARLEELKKEAECLGVPDLVIVDKEWLRAHEPNLSHDVVAALYAPTAGIISPYRLAYDLVENAMANGVKVLTGTEVEDIIPPQHSTDYFHLKIGSGECKAKYIVNAAGLYADVVARMVGITDFIITPRKGEEFLLDKKRSCITNHLLFPLPSETSKGTLVIKTSDGNPMIGPTAVDVQDKHDVETSDQSLSAVLSAVQKMVPSINGQDIIAYFAGLRPVAGKDFIIRHEDTVPGCITVAGIQSPGLTAAPAIACMVIDLLRDAGLHLKKKLFFKNNRPRTPHLFAMSYDKIKRMIEQDAAYGDIVCRCEMVSAKEIREAVRRGARTLDGIKFRTRAQAGRCHGGFCTTRIMQIMAEELGVSVTELTKRGPGSEIVIKERGHA